MKKLTVPKTLTVVVALAALSASAVGCRACCDDYPYRSYRHESLPPPEVVLPPSSVSAPIGLD